MSTNRVLLVNQTYEPLHVINWKHAVCLVVKNKASVVDTYDETIHSADKSFDKPCVIRLKHRIDLSDKEIKFCRENVFRRDGYTCQYCDEEFPKHKLTYDHVKPKAHGGQTNWDNIVTACRECNLEKDDRLPEEADMDLSRQPGKPMWIPFGNLRNIPEQWEPFLWS